MMENIKMIKNMEKEKNFIKMENYILKECIVSEKKEKGIFIKIEKIN